MRLHFTENVSNNVNWEVIPNAPVDRRDTGGVSPGMAHRPEHAGEDQAQGRVASDPLVHAKLDTIASLVGSIYQQIGSIVSRLNQLEIQTMTSEQKAELQIKARERYDELKRQAEEEIETALRQRADRGIPLAGDAVTQQDLIELD